LLYPNLSNASLIPNIKPKMRIYTCTPVDFKGDESFFARDSGLITRGLQKIGFESKSIMPGPVRTEDSSDLIRVPYSFLESVDWWKSQNIDTLVFYSWGAPKHWKIAKAIHKANIKLLVNLDTGGYFSTIQNPFFLIKFTFFKTIGEFGFFKGLLLWALRSLRDFLFPYHEFLRFTHCHQADFLLAVSPLALKRISRFFSLFYQEGLAKRLRFVPHPVSDSALYLGEPKSNMVIAVGRWTSADWQKNPELHIRVLTGFLEKHPDYRAVIVGPVDTKFEFLARSASESVRSRLILTGRLTNEQTLRLFAEAKISVALTRHESFHIPTGEALCCGCSIVSYPSLMIPSMDYFMQNSDGTMASSENVMSILGALNTEVALWQNGFRDPLQISSFWQKRLHSSQVAKVIAAL